MSLAIELYACPHEAPTSKYDKSVRYVDNFWRDYKLLGKLQARFGRDLGLTDNLNPIDDDLWKLLDIDNRPEMLNACLDELEAGNFLFLHFSE